MGDMLKGGGSTPRIQRAKPAPPPPEAPTPVDSDVIRKREEARRKAGLARGFAGNVRAGELDNSTANVGKSFLG